jgi:hypothetical protein
MRAYLRAYEIHTFVSGKWKIDSVFDDRDLALFEATRMEGSGRHAGVRVIEEEFDENTQKTRIRTIYRGSKLESSNAAALQASKETRRKAKETHLHYADERERKQAESVQAARRRVSNPIRLTGVFVAIAMLGIGTVIGLRYLSNIL